MEVLSGPGYLSIEGGELWQVDLLEQAQARSNYGPQAI